VTSSHRVADNRAISSGLVANVVLAVLKVCFGILGHSSALLADGINSTSDVVYYIVVKIFVALAHKPPDREHPYGHRQFESIAALVVGSFVITTAIAIFWNAINNVYDVVAAGGKSIPISLFTLWIALFTVGAKIVLTLYTKRVASRTGNAAILALSRDHRNDAFSASAVAIGILINRWGCAWGDPLVGAIVAIIIFYTGIQILRESTADLTDAVPGELLERQTREALRGVPGLKSIEEIQAHRFGPYFVLQVTVGVEGSISVAEGDRIATAVECAIYKGIPLVLRAYVHYHPVKIQGR
jgi:cation diffusion facilitator family transporter